MAGKKDPSIYDDRSNIGSSDELDEYGVWVKSDPQDLSSMPEMEDLPDLDDTFNTDLDLPDFSDISPDFPAETDPGLVQFEEIPENSELPQGPAPTSIDQDGFTEVPMNDFLDTGEGESIDFGNLDNLDNTENPEPSPAANSGWGSPPRQAEAQSGKDPDLSTQLLMKIAEELSSIRTELSTLKTELAVVRNETAKPEGAETHGGGSFFDEEDDEKIALTGDELNNILNTANFTEEAGSDAGEGISDDFTALETGFEEVPALPEESTGPLSDKPDIITDDDFTDSGDFAGGEITFDDGDLTELGGAGQASSAGPENTSADSGAISENFEVSMDFSSEDISTTEFPPDDLSSEDLSAGELPDFSDISSDGLDDLREGVAPMTKVSEDVSYLEEDPLASVEDQEQPDLVGTATEELDLSSRIVIDNPVEEPSPEDISIDFDMEEDLSSTELSNGTQPGRSSLEGGDADTGDFTYEIEDSFEIPAGEETAEEEELFTEESLTDDSFGISAGAADNSAAELSADEIFGEDSFPDIEEIEKDFSGFTADSESFENTEPSFETQESKKTSGTADVFSVPQSTGTESADGIPSGLKQELKTVLSYMDQLLESLPEDKIEEFAKSEYFDTYKKLFEELGLV